MAKKAIRPIRVDGNIAYVPLTQGYEAAIDAADVPVVQEWNWCAWASGQTMYAVRTDRTDAKQRLVYMHRLIMAAPDGILIDHCDRNGLNNCRSNLRTATRAQNARNTALRRDNKSGVKGVVWNKAYQKWHAQIRHDGRFLLLGYYDDLASAKEAYRSASDTLYGDFAGP